MGYRPSVFSTTLPHLAATNCAHLIIPFLPLRDRLKDTVEDLFGCEFELFVEFTGLIRSGFLPFFLMNRRFTAILLDYEVIITPKFPSYYRHHEKDRHLYYGIFI